MDGTVFTLGAKVQFIWFRARSRFINRAQVRHSSHLEAEACPNKEVGCRIPISSSALHSRRWSREGSGMVRVSVFKIEHLKENNNSDSEIGTVIKWTPLSISLLGTLSWSEQEWLLPIWRCKWFLLCVCVLPACKPAWCTPPPTVVDCVHKRSHTEHRY